LSKAFGEVKPLQKAVTEAVLIIFTLGTIGLIYNFLKRNLIFYPKHPLSLEEARERFERGVLFIDSRPKPVYEDCRIKGAISLSVDDLKGFKRTPKRSIVIYGAKEDALPLQKRLTRLGYNTEVFFDFSEWKKAGYPLEKCDAE
jgi:rhodanese-related sulfurtransferase